MNERHPRSSLSHSYFSRSQPYMPHPAPSEDNTDEMSSTASVFKTLVIPALISLGLFLLLSYIIIPVWRRYKNRYSSYLPLSTISTHTSSLRQRAQDALLQLILPSSWSLGVERGQFAVSAQDGFDEEDGEELFEVDEGRREVLSLDARRGEDEGGRRLSRDLEEGFKDDSDEDDNNEANVETRFGRVRT